MLRFAAAAFAAVALLGAGSARADVTVATATVVAVAQPSMTVQMQASGDALVRVDPVPPGNWALTVSADGVTRDADIVSRDDVAVATIPMGGTHVVTLVR